MAVVGTEVAEGNAGSTCKRLSGIVGAEGQPVVVGACIDGLRHMGGKRRADVNGSHRVAEQTADVIDGKTLGMCPALCHVGTIELNSRGDDHAVDANTVGKDLSVVVDHLSIGRGILHWYDERLEGARIDRVVDDDDAGLGLSR